MSRTKMKKVAINKEFFKIALEAKKLSINKLDNDSIIKVTEKTIRRALKDGMINPEILERIGERLNVSPNWLTGKILNISPRLDRNPNYMNPKNHPYNKNVALRQNINRHQHSQDLLVLHGISIEQYNLLPEAKQNGFKMELDLVITMLTFKYFSEYAKPDAPFLSNKKLLDMSNEVLSGKTYDELFDILEA